MNAHCICIIFGILAKLLQLNNGKSGTHTYCEQNHCTHTSLVLVYVLHKHLFASMPNLLRNVRPKKTLTHID